MKGIAMREKLKHAETPCRLLATAKKRARRHAAVLRETGVIAQNVNYAVKSRYIVNLLEEMHVTYEDQLPKQMRDKQSQVEYVERATVLIRVD